MSEPIVFISHNKIKEGKLEAFRKVNQERTPLIQQEKPGVGGAHVDHGDQLAI